MPSPYQSYQQLIDKALCASSQFSRERIWDNQQLSTDCSGIILLFLEELQKRPHDLPLNSRVVDLYMFYKKTSLGSKLQHIHAGDTLMWIKENPPKSGDSGHICLVTGAPQEIVKDGPYHYYELPTFEVTKEADGPRLHHLILEVDNRGRIISFSWDHQKFKRQKLLITPLFQEKRSECQRCQRSVKRCLCDELPQFTKKEKWQAPEISILRAPDEKKHALNSVNILNLCYQDLSLNDGIEFESTALQTEKNLVLIYPSSEAEPLESISDDEHYILLDGTWKKTKRILLTNPWLQQIPHKKVSLDHPPLYRIRKELSSEHYSTLEVFAQLIKKERPEQALQLQDIFKKMIDIQISEMGHETYKNNYKDYP